MKHFRKCIMVLLILAMTLGLTACGYELHIDLSDLDKPVVSQIQYFSEEELKTDTSASQRNSIIESYEAGEITYDEIVEQYKEGYAEGEYKKVNLKKASVEEILEAMYPDSGVTLEEQIKETYPNSKLEKVEKDLYKLEQKYIRNPESDSPNSYLDPNGEETWMEPQIISASSQKAEMYIFDNYRTSSMRSSGNISSQYGSYGLTAKLPFKVYYTNGEKTSKKEVSFDEKFASGEERCVAVASKKIFDVTKITAKIQKTEYNFDTGEYEVLSSKTAKNGKSYKVGDTLAISSKNAIKVFTITVKDGVNEDGSASVYNIVENSYRFDEPGKYKVKIVLANDTTKEFTIKIKE